MTKLTPFDVADFLDNEELISEYLSVALEDPDPDMFIAAVRNVAKAKGMTQVQRATIAPLTSLIFSSMRQGGTVSEAMVRLLPSSMRRMIS